jgi:predicted acylesterase/phospholipase RssA
MHTKKLMALLRDSQDLSCDVVMKGGITSGVAYPAAVLALSERYQFRSIGGASAGAIAAAVTAAAQFARASGGMDRLRDVQQQLTRKGLLVGLFQPTREARPLVDLLLSVQAAGSGLGRAWRFVRGTVSRLLIPVAIVVAFTFATLATLIRLAGGSAATMSGWGWLMLATALVLSALAGCVAAGTTRIVMLLRRLPASYYGMCLGKAEKDSADPALTEWLHTQIQTVAGLGEDDPLTFARLATADGGDLTLQMMTTDVTLARPVRYPLPADHAYLFSPDEWRSFFPDPVVEALCDDTRCPVVYPADGQVPALRKLPSDDLPIIVATRMSLAFPVLLSAVPLWQLDRDGQPVRHWISDGGIASNFPIHFFDAWLPRWPTFGLNLIPSRAADTPSRTAEAVETYSASRVPPPRRATISGVAGLLAQILDTMQNWRDSLQAELPGFNDRIAHITLDTHEGGMNITMPEEVIANVDRKGREAGEQLLDFDFREHWLNRYLGLMREVQTKLRGAADTTPSGVKAAFTEELAAWLADGGADATYGLELGETWYREATAATQTLLRNVDQWLPTAGSFAPDEAPVPSGTMRMTPDV